jgi:hypothetical protein
LIINVVFHSPMTNQMFVYTFQDFKIDFYGIGHPESFDQLPDYISTTAKEDPEEEISDILDSLILIKDEDEKLFRCIRLSAARFFLLENLFFFQRQGFVELLDEHRCRIDLRLLKGLHHFYCEKEPIDYLQAGEVLNLIRQWPITIE